MSRLAALHPQSFARRIAGPIVILLAAALAMLPQWHYGYSCGHDFDFHLVSWFEALHAWRHGLFYPHWAINPNYGAGEPRFVFYPPVTWMLGALLRLVMGWGYVPIALAWLLLVGTGLATRALARELLDDCAATLAGCAAIFSGYALFTAYERSAFGELTGGFWIPLLLLFALRDRHPQGSLIQRALDGSALPLTLLMAGTWLSDVPLGVIASYLLAAVALMAAILRRSWAPAIRAATAATLGIGLACFYLIPAAYEQKWVDVAQATNDPASRIESSWLFARHSDPALELHDTVLLMVSIIASTMLAVAFAGMVTAWLRGRTKTHREWWIVLAVIPAVILFLQLPVSLPVWNLLPKLRFVQFPWRWMVVLEAPMGIFFAAAIWPARRLARAALVAVCIVLFAGATVTAWRLFLQPCEPEDSVSAMLIVYASGAGFDGTDEYEPPNADDSLIPTGLPGACLVSEPAAELATPTPGNNPTFDADQHTCEAVLPAQWTAPEDLRIAGNVPSAGYLILKLTTYPAWAVTVNGRQTAQFDKREDGLMAIPVPQGPVNVDVHWTTTGDVIAGRWLSGFCLLVTAALALIERRSRQLERRSLRPHSALAPHL
jgi:hypothetical protein